MTSPVRRCSIRCGNRCSNSPKSLTGQALEINRTASKRTLLPCRRGTSSGDSPGILKTSSFDTSSPEAAGHSAKESRATVTAKLENSPFVGSSLDQNTSIAHPVDWSAVLTAERRFSTRLLFDCRDSLAARARAPRAEPRRATLTILLTEAVSAQSSVSTAAISESPAESSSRAGGASSIPMSRHD